MRIGVFAGLAAATLLGACAEMEVATRPPPDYVQDVGARVAAVDWSRIESRTVKLDDFAFAPDALVFDREVPYRLSLENTGQGTHSFSAEGFFKAIAVRRVTTPQDTIETPALVNLEVPAHQTYVVDFLPVEAGVFDLRCSEPLHSLFGMTGKITIQ